MRKQFVAAAKRLRRVWGVLLAITRHPAHKAHAASAVVMWLRLTASSMLTPTRQIVVPFVDDAVLSWPEGCSSVMNCVRYGLGEYGDMAFCLHLLRPGDLFCDIGANAGVYTVLAARAVGSTVLAVEPVPGTYDLLMQNVYVNRVSALVDARRIGAGRREARVHITANEGSYNHVVESADKDTVETVNRPENLGGSFV